MPRMTTAGSRKPNVLELRASLDQIIHTFSSTCCGRSLAPVSFKTFLLPFPSFCSLRHLWARDAVCSLAAMHDVWCRERPWLCLIVLLHPLQVITMMIRSTITKFMVMFPLVEERGCLYYKADVNLDRRAWVLIDSATPLSLLPLLVHRQTHTLEMPSDSEDSQADEHHRKRKGRFIDSLESHSRKRKRCAWILDV